jgi:hypothetical protein
MKKKMNYFDISGDDMAALMCIAGIIVSDFMPLIVVFVGLSIGFAIFRAVKR